jgi:hypothetical protein
MTLRHESENKMQLQLRKTKNYNQFKKLNQNRKVNTRQVSNLEKSIQKLDLTMFAPILVKNNYIIDGQHRFEACKNLDKEIYYVELDSMPENEIPTAITLLNSNAKNWSAEDYLNLYCHLQKQDYIIVRDYMKEFEVNSLSVAIYFLSGFSKYKSAFSKKFKDGEFEIDPRVLETAEKVGDLYKTIKRTVEILYPSKKDHKFITSNAFLFAFAEINSRLGFDKKNLLSNLTVEVSKGAYPLAPTDSMSNYYMQLANLHNMNLPENQKVSVNADQYDELDDLPF